MESMNNFAIHKIPLEQPVLYLQKFTNVLNYPDPSPLLFTLSRLFKISPFLSQFICISFCRFEINSLFATTVYWMWGDTEPIDQPTNEPIDQPTNEPIDQPTNEPIDQPTNLTYYCRHSSLFQQLCFKELEPNLIKLNVQTES